MAIEWRSLKAAKRRCSYQQIQASPSTITIRSGVFPDDTVSVYVIDNGPGIEAHPCSDVFNPFFTTKPVGEGTGSGLSISRQIMT